MLLPATMNPKNTRYRFGKKDRKNDNYRGRQGKHRKKQLYSTKPKSWQLIDEEISELKSQYGMIDSSTVKTFSDFPLSRKTQDGLKKSKYETPTEIQRETVGLALQGHDILGAAKTGSGKTLAFLIPVLECLFHQKWTQQDGLGALIISPTRELAYQIFEVLKKIGTHHDFSAGLVIGGKLLREESERINRTNIVICTPGRLLQHMDETVHFTADNLQVLVLDEADRILDLGFAQTMNAIIENLPPTRQTLLFSATQTKSVKNLARLSLKDPMYVSVHENAQHSTPAQLEQSYMVCELHEKINMLWSFVKNHLKSKTLVFIASCKQVKFIHEIFRRLRPGVTVLALHGAMHQLKRVAVYNQFCRKQNAVLFATDIAARGLDFPAVNWVIQLDCPEDANTYIHRAGRTARYEKNGQALLVLLPSEEEAMVHHLKEKKIPIENIRVNSKKIWSITSRLQSFLASDPSLKETAQRAFLGYLRSIFLMGDKKVFNIHKLDTAQFSSSLGLAIPPKVRFLKREQKRLAEKGAPACKDKNNEILEQQNSSSNKYFDSNVNDSDEDISGQSSSEDDGSGQSSSGQSSSQDSDSSDINTNISKNKKPSSDSRLEKKKQTKLKKKTVLSENDSYKFDIDEENDDLFTVKPRQIDSDSEDDVTKDTNDSDEVLLDSVNGHQGKDKKEKILTKYTVAKKIQKKKLQVNTKVVFDDEGEALFDELKTSKSDRHYEEDDYQGGINLEAAKKHMQEEDKLDKKIFREKIKKKHKEERLKQKDKRRKQKPKNESDEEDGMEAILDGEDNDESSNPFDLLPDPDKIYGEQQDSDDDQEEWESPVKKRKMEVKDSESDEEMSEELHHSDDDDDDDDNDDYSDDDDEEEEEDGLTLEDNEALALKLLSG